MKKITLVSVAALLLAATVFAPGALAQQLGDVESVTLGPGGSVTIAGTVQCIEGGTWSIDVVVRQSRGYSRPYTAAQYFDFLGCESTGPVSFEQHLFGNRPFKKGKAVVDARFAVCHSTCERERTVEEIRIR